MKINNLVVFGCSTILIFSQSAAALSYEYNSTSLFNESSTKSVDFVVNLTNVEPAVKNNLSKKLGEDLQASEDDPQIASFDEWTKQKLEEHQTKVADNQKNGVSTSGGNVVPHMAARNYASKECGAKVLLANPEAQNAGAVLNEKELDEYMLNPCNTEGQKWFVVELCETIQITKIEIANFELFSSRPKDFKVWSSERYPSPEWMLVGDWTAQDKRELQSFDVKTRLYAKYLKVELVSHYGTEHFCPLSLLRTVGISMVEEYEIEAMSQDQQQTKLAEGQASVQQNETVASPTTNSTPVLNDVSPPVTAEPPVKSDYLESAKKAVVLIAKEMYDKAQSVFIGTKPNPAPADQIETVTPTSLPPPSPVVNKSECPNVTVKDVSNERFPTITWCVCKTCRQNASWSTVPKFCGYYLIVTTAPPPSVVQDETSTQDDFSQEKLESFEDYDLEMPIPNDFSLIEDQNGFETETSETAEKFESSTIFSENSTLNNNTNSNISAILEKNETRRDVSTLSPPLATSLPGVATSTKESVFVRLNNRIRTLELNISLSSQYLSELSKKYRKQMEDIQRAFNKTSQLFNETDSKFEESLQKQANDLAALKEEVSNMRPLLSTLAQDYILLQKEAFQWIAVFVFLEVVILVFVLSCCFGRRSKNNQISLQDSNVLIEQAVARQLAILLQQNNFKNKVEEFLKKQDSCASASSSSHVDLINVDEPNQNLNRKKKCKKKQQQQQQKQIANGHCISRKSSDQTNFRQNNNTVSRDETAVDCVSAGILFSSSPDDKSTENGPQKKNWTKVSLKPKSNSRTWLLERQKSSNSTTNNVKCEESQDNNNKSSSSCFINLLKLTNPFDVLKSPPKRYSMDSNSRGFS